MRQICVIGLSQFGAHLARKLVNLGCEVLAIDMDSDRIDEIRDHVHRAIIGDARNYQMLDSVIPDTISEAIVSLGESTIEPSILCVLHLRTLGIENIVSTARNDEHAQILKAVGAREIVFPERDTAERVARHVANPSLRDMFPLDEDYRIMEIVAPKTLHGRTLAEADLRKSFDLLVLAVKEPGHDKFRYLPRAETKIKPEEVLMVLGRELDLAQFSNS